MPVVQVTRGAHFRREEGRLIRYGKGDRLEVTDRELEKFSDKFAVVDGKAKVKPKSEKPEGEGEGGAVPFDVETADLDALKAKASELGIELGPRWGERRIRDVITEALEEGSED
jgi:hypothetical protein